jgi:hypothetical protein
VTVHSFERFPGGNAPLQDAHGGEKRGPSVQGFAAVETVEVREERWELLREAQWSLRQWERHRRASDRERLVGALSTLAALIRETA